MSLIYLWIGKYRNIIGQEFVFNKNYEIKFDYSYDQSRFVGKSLAIKKIDNIKADHFYGENIMAINAIIGKNGTGKSSILELLSTPYQDSKALEDATYFAIYEGKEENVYVIEGTECIKDSTLAFTRLNGITPPFGVIYNENSNEADFSQYMDDDEPHKKTLSFLYKDNIRGQFNSDHDIFSAKISNRYYDVEFAELFTYANTRLRGDLNRDHQYSRAVIEISFDTSSEQHISDRITEYIFKDESKKDPFSSKYRRSSYDLEETLDQKKEKLILNFIDELFLKLCLNYIDRDIERDYLESESVYIRKLRSVHGSLIQEKYATNEDLRKAVSEALGYPEESDEQVAIRLLKACIIEGLSNEFSEKNHYFDLKQLTLNIIDYFSLKMGIKVPKSELIEDWFSLVSQIKDSKDVDRESVQVPLLTSNKAIKKFFKTYSPINPNDLSKLNSLDHELERQLLDLFVFKLRNVSDGEDYFLRLFCKIHQDLKTIPKKFVNVNLLFDEIELYLHPEWCRMLIYMLVKELRNYEHLQFRLIFATHSPFVISDIRAEDLFILNLDEHGQMIQDNNAIERSFGINIHTLFNKGMFMNATVGEFSRHKIQTLTDELEQLRERRLSGQEILFDKALQSRHRALIDAIGEDVLRQLLNRVYDEVYYSEQEIMLKNIQNMSIEMQQEIIKRLERSLKNAQN